MKYLHPISFSAALVCFASCDTTYQIPPEPVGATLKAALSAFGDDGRLRDRFDDSDGDGISDGDELDGWVITVDPDGYGVFAVDDDNLKVNLETRTVSSDPRFGDTDGDGLTDGEERQAKCDPRRADTDGDTLRDHEEVRRFRTSPSSVDSDGDARGGDPTQLRPPLFQLFDGGELRLVPDPANPSGERVIGRGATSPFLTDSDGDGVGDYDETLASLRRPTVADIPKLRLFPTPGAVFDMYLNVTTTEGRNDSTTFGTTTVAEEVGAVRHSSSIGAAFEQSSVATAYVAGEVQGGCCKNIAAIGSDVGTSLEHQTTLTQSVSTQFGVEFGANANRILNDARAQEQSAGITLKGGTLQLSLDVENDGPVTVRVANLVVGARRLDRVTQRYVPIAELTGRGDFTLAPYERRSVILRNADIPLAPMLALFEDPSTLQFTASRYDLLDQAGQDFDFTMADVRNATAAIEIDDGFASNKYWVSANVDRARGISIGQALSDVGLDFEAIPVDVDGTPGVEAWKVRIGNRPSEFWTEPAPNLGDTLPYTLTDGPGPRMVKRGWFGYVKRFDAESDPGTYYDNLFDAPLYPGDLVTLVYSQDLDRDGLSAAEERALGSSDATASSDAAPERPAGDGLSDFWEAREGWTVTWPGRTPYRVFPGLTSVDTDGDGLDDFREASETKTDPWLVDTDQDTRSDLFEAEDTTYGLDPLVQQLALPTPTATCNVVTYVAPSGDPYYELVAGGSDVEGDLVNVTIHFLALDAFFPSSPGTPTGSFESKRIFDYCVDPAAIEVSATDSLGNVGRTSCIWSPRREGDTVFQSACEAEPPDAIGDSWTAWKY